VTIEKLRWLLSKTTAVFGDRRIGQLTSQEIAGQHPFESGEELEALAAAIGPPDGPVILFAAATGLRSKCHFSAPSQFVVCTPDYLNWDAFGYALARHVRHRNSDHRNQRIAAEARHRIAA
jgi:hypothetical protein